MSVKVVAVASQKGGVGKTTTVVNVAHGLALKNRDVMIVDADPQGHAGISLGIQPESGIFNTFVSDMNLMQVARQTGRAHMIIVPGDKRTATAQTVLAAEQRDVLSSMEEAFIRPLKGKDAVVVFDTAPSVGGFQEAAMFAADLVLVPVATDHLALFGVTGVIETLGALRRRGWKGMVLALPTFYDEVTKHSRSVYEMLKERLEAMSLPVAEPIHRATDIREASAEGKTIFEFAPSSRSAQEYARIVWRVMEVLK